MTEEERRQLESNKPWVQELVVKLADRPVKEGRVTQTGQERFHRERRCSVCWDPDSDEENLFWSPL